MSSIALRISLVVTGLALVAADSPRPFHAPTTAAERTLDALLHEDATRPDLLKSSRHFTRALRDAWQNAEKKAIAKNCAGTDNAGEECGLGFDPFLCAQDVAESYTYRTDSQRGEGTTIEALASSPDAVVVTYRLTRARGRWMVDGVDCGDSKFNWK